MAVGVLSAHHQESAGPQFSPGPALLLDANVAKSNQMDSVDAEAAARQGRQ